MSKKDKKNNANKLEHSKNNNTVECKNHGHNSNLANDCDKENCSCTKHDNCSAFTDGE